MTLIKFKKMQGLGNDFVVINNLLQTINLTPAAIQKISDRHCGIGCDQVLVLEKADNHLYPDIDFIYKIYNQDGSESGQCGNGARCMAKFIQEEKLSLKTILRLKTFSSILEIYQEKNHLFRVNMGVPQEIKKISVQHHHGIYLSLGNPHGVFITDNITDKNLYHNLNLYLYLNNINIGFMQVINKNHIKLRVFERGAGETLACGSGACAAVVAGITQGLLEPQVNVELALGILTIQWQGLPHPVWMTGPAETVFEGVINI